jgi:hypothetical protein
MTEEKKPRTHKTTAEKKESFAKRRNAHLLAIEKINTEEAEWIADREARAAALTAGLTKE